MYCMNRETEHNRTIYKFLNGILMDTVDSFIYVKRKISSDENSWTDISKKTIV